MSVNSLVEDELPGTHDLRDHLLGMISDQDLAYKLPGSNPTLGELCEEMGHTQQVYIHSFKTFKQDWGYRDAQLEAPYSVASLTNLRQKAPLLQPGDEWRSERARW
jgi:hypothetical protein